MEIRLPTDRGMVYVRLATSKRNSRMPISKLALLLLIVTAAAPLFAEGIAVKSGEKIAFMGDSITADGMGSPSGYCRLVISGLDVNGVTATPIAAGVSGHKSNQMLERLERDVLSKKPEWMTLSCGVNDVWHGNNGVPLEPYKKNITEILEKCKAAGVKVMILTATMIGEDAANANNQKLAAYNDFLRQLAKEQNYLIADLNGDMQAALKKIGSNGKTNVYTRDGVHMNPKGDMLMAESILRAFGLNDEQIKKAQDKWLDTPNAWEVAGKMRISIRQYQQLVAYAEKQNRPLHEILNEAVAKAVEGILK